MAAFVAVGLLLLPTAELEQPAQRPELAALVLLAGAGALALAIAGDLLQLIVGLETLALSAAVLVAMAKGEAPLEAAFKFFVLNAAGLAVMAYGLGLIYLATGSLAFPELTTMEATQRPLVVGGIVMVAAGLALELALVPLHWGALDAYTASAPGVAGFVMAASKLAGAMALARLAAGAGTELAGLLVVLGALTIIWGTLGALAQYELRRLLGYSTLAHAGFLALALGSGPPGVAAAVFYAIVYAATALLVFACLSGRGAGPIALGTLLQDPLGRYRSLALTLGLFSLAGIPPTPGFWAKLGVLVVAWEEAGPVATVIAAGGAVAGVLYYFRPLPDLLVPSSEFRVPSSGSQPELGTARAAIALAGLAVVALGLAPGFVWSAAAAVGR